MYDDGEKALVHAVEEAKDSSRLLCIEDSVNRESSVKLQQKLYCAPDKSQLKLLVAVLLEHMEKNPATYKIIVFTPTSRHASYLAEMAISLRNLGKTILEIHSKMTQAKRSRASEEFRGSSQTIIFSSDVSARGMDYPDITMVVQLGLVSRNQYIHRIGRTARADKGGSCVLLCAPYEFPVLKRELEGFFKPDDIVDDYRKFNFASGGLEKIIIQSYQRMDALRDLTSNCLGSLGVKLNKLAQAAATSWIGYYALECNRLGWGKVDLVEHAMLFSRSLGLTSFPELTPKTIDNLRLHETSLGKVKLKFSTGRNSGPRINSLSKAKRKIDKRSVEVGNNSTEKLWNKSKKLIKFF